MRAFLHCLEPFIGGLLGGIAAAEVQRQPVEQPLVIGDVGLADFRQRFLHRRLKLLQGFRLRVTVTPIRQLHPVIGGGGDKQGDIAGIGNQ